MPRKKQNPHEGKASKAACEGPAPEFSLLQAAIDRGRIHEISEHRVAETYVGLRDGVVVPTPDNLAAMARGEKFLVAKAGTRPWRGAYDKVLDKTVPAEGWRNKSAFHADADDLLRKLRSKRKDPAKDPDAKWLDFMSWAWVICLERNASLEDLAEYLADEVGEGAYFDSVVRPVLRHG
jgi:hypothetical protein